MEISNTGERVIPAVWGGSRHDYLIYQCHLATYRFALNHVAGKNVLDFGCGSGYGSNMLAEKCTHVTGVDISREAVEYARKKYIRSNLEYKVINSIETDPLPFDDNSFDAVTSSHVIEHINADKTYLKEIERVLRPGGVVVVITPDRSTRLLPFQKPWIPYHVREYSYEGLREIMSSVFGTVQMFEVGGDKDVITMAVNRYRNIKWLCLPFTLPFVPESIRKGILKFLMDAKRKGVSARPDKASVWSFDINSFTVSESVYESIALIAVAYKKE